jgi:hypothetical protein
MLHVNFSLLRAILTLQSCYCTYNYSVVGADLRLAIEAGRTLLFWDWEEVNPSRNQQESGIGFAAIQAGSCPSEPCKTFWMNILRAPLLFRVSARDSSTVEWKRTNVKQVQGNCKILTFVTNAAVGQSLRYRTVREIPSNITSII